MWVIENNALTNDEFPALAEAPLNSPYPDALWVIDNGKLTRGLFPALAEAPLNSPYPDALWVIDNGKLTRGLFPDIDQIGAFAHASSLSKITIPKSVESIGEHAFRNTSLSTATVHILCDYHDTSFPDNCHVEYYSP